VFVKNCAEPLKVENPVKVEAVDTTNLPIVAIPMFEAVIVEYPTVAIPIVLAIETVTPVDEVAIPTPFDPRNVMIPTDPSLPLNLKPLVAIPTE